MYYTTFVVGSTLVNVPICWWQIQRWSSRWQWRNSTPSWTEKWATFIILYISRHVTWCTIVWHRSFILQTTSFYYSTFQTSWDRRKSLRGAYFKPRERSGGGLGKAFPQPFLLAKLRWWVDGLWWLKVQHETEHNCGKRRIIIWTATSDGSPCEEKLWYTGWEAWKVCRVREKCRCLQVCMYNTSQAPIKPNAFPYSPSPLYKHNHT